MKTDLQIGFSNQRPCVNSGFAVALNLEHAVPISELSQQLRSVHLCFRDRKRLGWDGDYLCPFAISVWYMCTCIARTRLHVLVNVGCVNEWLCHSSVTQCFIFFLFLAYTHPVLFPLTLSCLSRGSPHLSPATSCPYPTQRYPEPARKFDDIT